MEPLSNSSPHTLHANPDPLLTHNAGQIDQKMVQIYKIYAPKASLTTLSPEQKNTVTRPDSSPSGFFLHIPRSDLSMQSRRCKQLFYLGCRYFCRPRTGKLSSFRDCKFGWTIFAKAHRPCRGSKRDRSNRSDVLLFWHYPIYAKIYEKTYTACEFVKADSSTRVTIFPNAYDRADPLLASAEVGFSLTGP